jgi:hypothetical protein
MAEADNEGRGLNKIAQSEAMVEHDLSDVVF